MGAAEIAGIMVIVLAYVFLAICWRMTKRR